jgi:hypothetical protein
MHNEDMSHKKNRRVLIQVWSALAALFLTLIVGQWTFGGVNWPAAIGIAVGVGIGARYIGRFSPWHFLERYVFRKEERPSSDDDSAAH